MALTPPPPEPPAVVAAIAEQQGGHIATWQCVLVGLSTTWVDEQADRRGWTLVRRGTHRLGGVAESPVGCAWAALLAIGRIGAMARARRHLAEGHDVVTAAVMAVTDGVAATAWTGAVALGHSRPWPVRPQVVAGHGTTTEHRDIRLVRTRVGPVTWEERGGLPCAHPERVLWDAAWVGRRQRGIVRSVHDLAIHLDRTRVLSVSEVVGAVAEPSAFGLPSRVPWPLQVAAERLAPGFSHSGLEARWRAIATGIAATLGIELEPRPYTVWHDGQRIAEADIAAPLLRWDAEVDGPHHDTLEMRRRDRGRDQRMDGIDWITTRYHHRLSDEEFADRWTADAIRIVEQRGRRVA